MGHVNDLVEWDYLGTHNSVYVKHFTDEEGKKGMTLIYEDITRQKVTEIVIPPRVFPSFLRAVSDGALRTRGIL